MKSIYLEQYTLGVAVYKESQGKREPLSFFWVSWKLHQTFPTYGTLLSDQVSWMKSEGGPAHFVETASSSQERSKKHSVYRTPYLGQTLGQRLSRVANELFVAFPRPYHLCATYGRADRGSRGRELVCMLASGAS